MSKKSSNHIVVYYIGLDQEPNSYTNKELEKIIEKFRKNVEDQMVFDPQEKILFVPRLGASSVEIKYLD
jgi:hypothetical protein